MSNHTKDKAGCGSDSVGRFYRSRPHLKPCPFCGCEEINVVKHESEGRGIHHGEDVFTIGCYGCGGSVPAMYNKSLLIERWNRRAGGV